MNTDKYIFVNNILDISFCPTCFVAIRGKVFKIRRIGKLTFIILFDQTDKCQIVAENMNTRTIQKGDYLLVRGEKKYSERSLEILAKEISILNNLKSENLGSRILESKIDSLIYKSIALQSINEFMGRKSFLPVISPTIVGNWVEGKTNSFRVDYYGKDKYLTLNNMLYHQIMLISGYSRIYEMSKIFRQDKSSHRDRLSEFISVDISMSFSESSDIMTLVEDLILFIIERFSAHKIEVKVPINFKRISFSNLIKAIGDQSVTGAQLPSKAREYLTQHFDSFVWVYGFPEEKRRFFVRSTNGESHDYQLWYKGEHQIASGSEREMDLETLYYKLEREGKKTIHFDEYFEYFKGAVPSMSEIGFGIDRFLLDVLGGKCIEDFVAFPRTSKSEFNL